MTKLSQIVAIEKGAKSSSQPELTTQYQTLQKSALLSGIARTYQPKDEEGESLPSESTRVQVKVDDVPVRVAEVMTRLFDVTATKEWAKTSARADVVVHGAVLLADVPVTYLLFLE